MEFPMNRTAKWIAAWMAFGLLAGCSSFDFSKRIPWGMGGEGHLKAPMKVVAVWSEAMAHSPEQGATRGFGGRIFFYPADGDKPVKVKGTLEVYGFEEGNRALNDTRPNKKIVFPRDEFANLYSDGSPIGPSYSIWVPWDAAHGPQKEVSLIVRFTPEKAPLVVSEMTTHTLHGTPVPGGDILTSRKNFTKGEVQQVSYEEPTSDGRPARATSLETTTIPMRRIITPHAGPNPINAARQTGTASVALPPVNSASAPAQQPYPLQGATGQQPVQQPRGHSGLATRPAPGGPIFPPGPDRGPWRQNPRERPRGPGQ
jgi:hypothetical protein